MAEFIRGPNGEMLFVPNEPQPQAPQETGIDPSTAPVVDATKFKWSEDPTSPVIDRVTGKRIRVDEKELDNLIKNGRVGYSQDHDVSVVDDEGKQFTIKGSKLRHALDNGFRTETSTERGVKQYVEENKGAKGSIDAFLRNYVDELAFTVPSTIEDHTLNDFEKAKREALKEDHKVANALGGIAGFIGNLVVTEGVGAGLKGIRAAQLGVKAIEGVNAGEKLVEGARAAEKLAKAEKLAQGAEKLGGVADLTSKLVAQGVERPEAIKIADGVMTRIGKSALNNGAIGAAYTAPKAITEAALGDPESAGESLLIGFGAGAALGGLGKIGGETLTGIGEFAAPKLKGLANRQVAKSLIHSSDKFSERKMAALPGGADAIGAMLSETTDATGKKLEMSLTESMTDYADRLLEAKKAQGRTLEATYNKLDELGIKQWSHVDIANRLKNEIIDPLTTKLGKSREARKLQELGEEFMFSAMKNATTEEEAAAAKLGFKDLWNYRKQLDDLIYKESQVGVTDPVKTEVQKFRQMLQGEMDQAIGQAEKEGKIGKGALDEYRNNNLKFRQLSVAQSAAQRSAITRESSSGVGLTDAVIGYAPAIGALLSGNLLGAVKGIAVGIGNKLRRENGNLIAAKILNAIGASSKNAERLLAHGGSSPQAGILMAEKAMGDVGYKLDTIPGIINGLGMVGKRATVRASTDKQTLEYINDLVKDKDALQNNIDQMSSIVGEQGAPNVAKAYAAKQLNALNYIKDNLPVPPPPDPYKKVQSSVPVGEAAKFARKLEIVQDPYKVLEHLSQGTLTPEHVDALYKTYPKLANAITSKIVEHESSGDMAPVGSQYRKQIEMLKQTPQSSTVEFWQNVTPKKEKPKKMGAGHFENTAKGTMTPMDRINYKGIGK